MVIPRLALVEVDVVTTATRLAIVVLMEEVNGMRDVVVVTGPFTG